MPLLLALLALAAGLHQGIGNEDSDEAFAALSTTLLEVQQEIVDKHNDIRRHVNPSGSNILKMEWNETAAANAQSWAEECVYKHSPMSRRTIEGGMECGENIFFSTVPQSWSVAIQDWMEESNFFIFKEGPSPNDEVVGHYTQLVWYSSYLIGCGVAHCPHKEFDYISVCHYCPAGNVEGKLYEPYKVGEPCGSCAKSCDNGLCTNPCPTWDNYRNCGSLKEAYSCENRMLPPMCPASCRCEDKIY